MHLLPHWHRSGRAIYACDSCSTYDIIIPVRYRKQREHQESSSEMFDDYCPLLVSVKNQQYVTTNEEETYKVAMEAVLTRDNIQTGLCMLLLVGLRQFDGVTPDIVNRFVFQEGCVQSFTVIMPSDDPFGISQFLEMVSLGGGEQSEIYVSHSEAFSTPREIPTQNLLRAPGSPEAQFFLDELREKFENGEKKRKREGNSGGGSQ